MAGFEEMFLPQFQIETESIVGRSWLGYELYACELCPSQCNTPRKVFHGPTASRYW